LARHLEGEGMIALSPRHSRVLAIALLLMAIPIWYHAAARPRTFSCSNPDALIRSKVLPMVEEFGTLPFSKEQGFFDSAAGTLSLPGRWKAAPQWRISRSFQLQRYYYHPANSYAYLFPDDELVMRTLVVDGVELPIHLRLDESRRNSVMTAYLYILGGRPIRNPFTGTVAAAIPQLIGGRLPLTEILVSGVSAFTDEEANREALIDWIRSSWIRYDEVCNL
jgi:hypothetical protein